MFCCPLSEWIRILGIIGAILKELWDSEEVQRLRENARTTE